MLVVTRSSKRRRCAAVQQAAAGAERAALHCTAAPPCNTISVLSRHRVALSLSPTRPTQSSPGVADHPRARRGLGNCYCCAFPSVMEGFADSSGRRGGGSAGRSGQQTRSARWCRHATPRHGLRENDSGRHTAPRRGPPPRRTGRNPYGGARVIELAAAAAAQPQARPRLARTSKPGDASPKPRQS